VAEDPSRPPPRGIRAAASEGRELALKYLFGADLRGREDREPVDSFLVHQEGRGTAAAFARELIDGVLGNVQSLDAVIAETAENWRLARMSVVDRNILRIGAYELLFWRKAPIRVVLNEAIELAKRYGAAGSGAFVNGVLDRVARRPDAGPARGQGGPPCSASSPRP
jgi:N utilization substance protein B